MRNKDEIFFDVFAKSAENTIFICNMLGNFDKTEKSLNSIYSATDKEKSEQQRYFNLLEKAFITPIERELLLETSVKFLDFSERVKDIAASVYYTGIYEKQTVDKTFQIVLKNICERVGVLSKELVNYKNSKKLKEIILEIRKIETEGESLYVRSMKKLFSEEKDTKRIVCCQKINALYLKAFNAGGNIARQTEKIIIS